MAGQHESATNLKDQNLPVINSKNVLIENDEKGLWGKEVIRTVFQNYNRDELSSFEALLDAICLGQKITTSPFPKSDENGEKYFLIQQHAKNGVLEYKVRYFDGLEKLISMYINAEFVSEIYFEVLYHESTI
ncbi:hypothetical protein H9X96_18415 [Pedobacter sp. N36a]|uniref:hypothetical protein n=1 Tax=Pedobacter sp. N36a TaxID=2767996 RepID=UPI00165701C8|nr:hypothetical protein [Pedobacter sp. N36a]MBC8987742.1 hypothetical protein [Pedobacter sp. N36a]